MRRDFKQRNIFEASSRRNTMTTRSFLTAFAVSSAVLCGGVMMAQSQAVEYVGQPGPVYMQAPVVNIGNQHGNLRSAQGYIVSAYQKINRAQQDNDDQLGGHAQRAKELLIQAEMELRLAANVANSEGR
jgi:hypothetical protein